MKSTSDVNLNLFNEPVFHTVRGVDTWIFHPFCKPYQLDSWIPWDFCIGGSLGIPTTHGKMKGVEKNPEYMDEITMKSNIDTKNDGPWKMYEKAWKHGVILGIYVGFQGGVSALKMKETCVPMVFNIPKLPSPPLPSRSTAAVCCAGSLAKRRAKRSANSGLSWFHHSVVWVSLSNNPFHDGIPGIQTTWPQTTNLPLVEKHKI